MHSLRLRESLEVSHENIDTQQKCTQEVVLMSIA